MWFGTWDGLNMYNGRDIHTYRYNRNDINSISNNIIRQVLEQDKQYLWVSTDYGINRWNKETRQFTRYYIGTENKTPKQERSYIIGITSDHVIIGFVRDEGLFRFDNGTETFLPVPTDFSNYIKDFVIDPNDMLYILFPDGEIKVHDLKEGFTSLKMTDLKRLDPPAPIERIFQSNGYFIANSGPDIFVYGTNGQYIKKISTGIVSKNISQIIHQEEKLYISFYEGGCVTYNLSTDKWEWIREIPEIISVFSLYYGSQNILWAGSDGHGVLQVYDYHSLFETVHTEHAVRSFCEDEAGNILIGTKGGGIKRLNRKTGKIGDFLTTKNALISNSVYSIVRNREGDIFIGTEGEGINILRKESAYPEKLHLSDKVPYFKAVYSLHFTNNDSLLWVGTSGYGLIRMEIKKERNTYIIDDAEQFISSDQVKPLNNDIVYTIASCNDILWFGTRGGGINKINIPQNSIERIEETENNILLTNNDVLCLLVDEQELWAGTSYGLNKLNLDNTPIQLRQYTESNGLNNNTIHGILKDENHTVWVSTSQGLTSINKQNETENFTFQDGLQNDEFSDGAYYKDSGGFFYFGGVSGFNYFHPEQICFRNYDAPLELSALRIYNAQQNIHERIRNHTLKLSYEERYVTFTFISKDLIKNENCEYAYRLLNYSDEWMDMGNNPNIIFSKLPPGKYGLEVKNTNGDKRWGSHIYQLRIQVGYPWWLSVPAIMIYLVILIVIIYMAQSVIRNRIRLSRQILIEQLEMKQQQKTYESKLNFFTNVAHEFFTPLTLIFGGAQHLLEKEEMNVHTKKYLHIIKNNAERMQRLISELMEFRKAKSGFTPLHPEDVNIKLLTEYVSDNYVEVLQENKIDFRVNIHDISSLYTDRDSLEKIFFNLYSNAFKYTPPSGYIHLEIWQDSADSGNALHFTIRNSGRGLTEQQIKEIFDKYKIFDALPNVKNAVSTGVGLSLTKSLVELLGGKIEVRSLLGEYVEFSFVIPNLDIKQQAVTTNKESTLSSPTSSVPVPHNGKKENVSLLVIDDEKNIRGLLKDILEPLYSVSEASDGKEALNIINHSHPDIIITDIMMPNMDGISLINALKSNPKTGYIPIISLSAKTSVNDHVDAYSHGADLYITKPFHPRHIISAIDSLLSKQTLLKEYFNSNISSYRLKNGAEIHQEDERLIEDIVEYVRKNIDDDSLSPNTIAEFMNISKATLYRKLKDLTDKTPSEFVRSIRLEYASKLLIKTKFTVSEIMYRSGFTNKSYFYREFQKLYGCSPKDYRLGKE
jgi:signal transduction histidine kinase/CheY-like chemotaxis protein/AraC-like DNA-binding protein/ligand-binding sensor domain-containing protein